MSVEVPGSENEASGAGPDEEADGPSDVPDDEGEDDGDAGDAVASAEKVAVPAAGAVVPLPLPGAVLGRRRMSAMSSAGSLLSASAFCSSASDARSSPPEEVERILRGRVVSDPLDESAAPDVADTIASTSSALRMRLTAFTPSAAAISESWPRSLPSS